MKELTNEFPISLFIPPFIFFRIIKVKIIYTYINTWGKYFMVTDIQVYTALVIAAVASVLAMRLGSTLYN